MEEIQFAENLENPDLNAEPLRDVWKGLNIKRDAYLQILKMQEDAMFTGSRKAHILHKPEAKFCRYCKDVVCSINHILLGCPIVKKAQIKRHDNICKQIYYAAYRKYKQFDNQVWPDEIPKCTRLEKENVTIIYNKEILPRSTGKYHKRPDVYVEEGVDIAYIFDVTVVKNDRARSAYSEKVNNYQCWQITSFRNPKMLTRFCCIFCNIF